ncbi:MAG: AMP-binding protein, partial [Candidatus Bathyarchaeia archaeon]
MRCPLWVPSEEYKRQANVTKFIDSVNKEYNLQIDTYHQLYNWSIENISDFWAAVWKFGEIKASRRYEVVVDNLSKFPGAKWFIGASLNFAENLLRYNDAHEAFMFKGETQKSKKMTYAELHNSVARLAKALREIGVIAGDRVVAYMPNLTETAIAMLAATSIGAIWASCGAELGPRAVLDRFGQIQPKVLFTVNGYYYKGKTFSVLSNAEEVAKGISSLKKAIVIPYVEENPDISSIPKSVLYDEFISQKTSGELRFEQLPFDHPVYIMFSSGTTGKPKCMVQG